jgi:hypothetical protein
MSGQPAFLIGCRRVLRNGDAAGPPYVFGHLLRRGSSCPAKMATPYREKEENAKKGVTVTAIVVGVVAVGAGLFALWKRGQSSDVRSGILSATSSDCTRHCFVCCSVPTLGHSREDMHVWSVSSARSCYNYNDDHLSICTLLQQSVLPDHAAERLSCYCAGVCALSIHMCSLCCRTF